MEELEKRIAALETKVFGGVKDEPVPGWYKYEDDDHRQTRTLGYSSDGVSFDYGFSVSGRWSDKFIDCRILHNKMVLADPKEVEQRMEAMLKNKYPQFKNFSYHAHEFSLCFNEGYGWNELGDEETLLIDNGVFKEIIEEPLTLNGKELVIDYEDNSIQVIGNCYEIDDFKDFVCHCNGYDIDSIRKDGETYLIKDLKQLLTKIEENENR